jgi:hypothetical protein
MWLTRVAPNEPIGGELADRCERRTVAITQPDQQMPTVKVYLTSWLENYASVHLKPSKAEGYRQVCKGHLFSAIGDRATAYGDPC